MSEGMAGLGADDWNPAGVLDLHRVGETPALPHHGAVAGIVHWLPRLGSVLWVWRDNGHSHRSAHRMPAEDPVAVVLLACAEIGMDAVVTPNGPREYLQFIGRDGRILAKLFVLPDTDFLAWEQMLVSLPHRRLRHDPESWQGPLPRLRAALARLGTSWRALPLRFAHGGSLMMTGVPTLSRIGATVARRIARDERAAWSCHA